MAKRRRKKSRTKRVSFKARSPRKRKRQKTAYRPSLAGILKVFAAACVLAGVVTAFVFLKRTVSTSQKTLTPILVDPPAWITEQLAKEIYAAAKADGEDLNPSDELARSVQETLSRSVAWLDQVQVRLTNNQLLIGGQWRKPIAMVKRGPYKFYVDAQMVILDYVPLPDLPIVEVKELSTAPAPPAVGQVWQKKDLAAAVEVLSRLDARDALLTNNKPLLYEIDSIDVSNFDGREDSRAAHIILYAGDVEIIWGAEVDNWQQHLESTDEEKIAKLYWYYEDNGTLRRGAKRINLRDPRDNIPLPIDKY
ncbi:MAG: cell division protein FtsQ/DivIB [Planctomycetota bacterium]